MVRKSYPVTGFSLCNALGRTTSEVLEGLWRGQTGLRPCHLNIPFETHTGLIPGELPNLLPEHRVFDTRQARIARLAFEGIGQPVEAAISRWGSSRVAMVLGTSTGGIGATEKALAERKRFGALPTEYDCLSQHAFHALTDFLSALTGISGPGFIVSAACASSAKVFGSAQRLLDADVADAVLVGGVDSICEFTLRGFAGLQILSRVPCKPFSSDRDGINIGEGGAFALIEREGNGGVLLMGVGETSDAHHMVQPHPNGDGAVAAMSMALEQTGLESEQIDVINAHGTATRTNDLAEATAIDRVFPSRPPVLSTKGYTGHMLGAGGATEAVFVMACLERNWIPTSLGAEPLDTTLPIRVSVEPTIEEIRYGLSNSFAFGGINASVLFGARQ